MKSYSHFQSTVGETAFLFIGLMVGITIGIIIGARI